jgi:hypothetical protein
VVQEDLYKIYFVIFEHSYKFLLILDFELISAIYFVIFEHSYKFLLILDFELISAI